MARGRGRGGRGRGGRGRGGRGRGRQAEDVQQIEDADDGNRSSDVQPIEAEDGGSQQLDGGDQRPNAREVSVEGVEERRSIALSRIDQVSVVQSADTIARSASRKRKLEIEAAEMRASIKRQSLQIREQLQLERENIELGLVEERLAAQLAPRNSSSAGSSSRTHLPAEGSIRNEDRVRQWVDAQSTAGSRRVDTQSAAGSRRVDAQSAAGSRHVDARSTAGSRSTVGSRRVEAQSTAGPRRANEQSTPSRGDVQSTVSLHRVDARSTAGSRCVNSRSPESRRFREPRQGGAISSQLINRLSSNRNLPSFGGDSLEWLKFKRAYELSTDLGGYSEGENIARLHECLRGDAKEAVSALMITATSASQIMESLELRFGHPDVIVNRIVREIKALPIVGSRSMDIITFATKIKNAVAAMEAVGHIGYLHSPELINEIVGKLPHTTVPHFNRYVMVAPREEPRLVTISKFLHSEAEMACKAGTAQIQSEVTNLHDRDAQTTRNARRRRNYASPHQPAHVLTAAERRAYLKRNKRIKIERPQNSSDKEGPCILCDARNHSISKCERFLTQPVGQRWQWARKNGVCFRCLKRGHSTRDCQAATCKIQDCGKAHHDLLHRLEA